MIGKLAGDLLEYLNKKGAELTPAEYEMALSLARYFREIKKEKNK